MNFNAFNLKPCHIRVWLTTNRRGTYWFLDLLNSPDMLERHAGCFTCLHLIYGVSLLNTHGPSKEDFYPSKIHSHTTSWLSCPPSIRFMISLCVSCHFGNLSLTFCFFRKSNFYISTGNNYVQFVKSFFYLCIKSEHFENTLW